MFRRSEIDAMFADLSGLGGSGWDQQIQALGAMAASKSGYEAERSSWIEQCPAARREREEQVRRAGRARTLTRRGARLTDADRDRIWRLHREGTSLDEIRALYGIGVTAAAEAASGQTVLPVVAGDWGPGGE